jgi:hypothetical protein
MAHRRTITAVTIIFLLYKHKLSLIYSICLCVFTLPYVRCSPPPTVIIKLTRKREAAVVIILFLPCSE